MHFLNKRFEYKISGTDRRSMCHIYVSQYEKGEIATVVASEIKDNPGPSITNSFEDLAFAIMNGIGIRKPVLWLEHYGPASYFSPLVPKEHHFDLVTFDMHPDGLLKLTNVSWHPIEDVVLRQLLGDNYLEMLEL